MDAPKLCKDCRHYIAADGATWDRCSKRTISATQHLVRGGDKSYGFCESTRAEQYCGAEGRWFEPIAHPLVSGDLAKQREIANG